MYKKVTHIIYRYRYLFGLAVVLLGVALNINGSSIACWSSYISENDTGIIGGTARTIRSDEWKIFTPLIISQFSGDSFSWFSDILRADSTDTFMVYALPVKTILIIFRPFLLGFMIFGIERGLAFFWCGRTVFLLIVSFDFMMLITERDRKLSIGGSFLIVFSSALQWWFAINGFAEMLIFGEGFILLFDKWMKEKRNLFRFSEVLGMVWCIGGFGLTLYPSWMIPFAYVFLAFFIWIIIKDRKEFSFHKIDIAMVVAGLILLAASVGYVYHMSKDTISAVMNTSYPGARIETGGGQIYRFFYYPATIFFTFTQDFLPTNVCEMSVFYSFFPLCFVMAFLAIRKSGKDALLISSLIVDAILIVWCTIGFPAFLAKLSLFSLSQSSRSMMAETYLEMMILFRSVYLIRKNTKDEEQTDRKNINIISFLALSFVLSIFVMIVSKHVYGGYIGAKKAAAGFLVVFVSYMIFFAYAYSLKISSFIPYYIVALSLLTGIRVNPVQRGVGDLLSTDLASEIKSIVKEDSGAKWIVSNCAELPVQNYPVMMGARTINCTNTYPALKTWEKIDGDKAYYDIYNRYAAGINMTILPDYYAETLPKFALPAPDCFDVFLTNSDVKKLDISYILSRDDLSTNSDSVVSYEEVYESIDGYYIFKTNIK